MFLGMFVDQVPYVAGMFSWDQVLHVAGNICFGPDFTCCWGCFLWTRFIMLLWVYALDQVPQVGVVAFDQVPHVTAMLS